MLALPLTLVLSLVIYNFFRVLRQPDQQETSEPTYEQGESRVANS